MMKENSKKSLLLLYQSNKKHKIVGEANKVVAVLEQLVPGGKRAMIAWWQKQGWIESFMLPGGRHLALTSLGKATLEQELPIFRMPSAWNGQWQLIVLKQAPEIDPAFHGLRDAIRRANGLVVTRGVYAFVDQVPAELSRQWRSKYAQNISLLTVATDSNNDLNDIAVKYYQIHDLISLYSGISRDIDRLLVEKDRQKGLNHRQKLQCYSLYSRFFAVFCVDNGLMQQLFPSSPNPLILLLKLQGLLLQV